MRRPTRAQAVVAMLVGMAGAIYYAYVNGWFL